MESVTHGGARPSPPHKAPQQSQSPRQSPPSTHSPRNGTLDQNDTNNSFDLHNNSRHQGRRAPRLSNSDDVVSSGCNNNNFSSTGQNVLTSSSSDIDLERNTSANQKQKGVKSVSPNPSSPAPVLKIKSTTQADKSNKEPDTIPTQSSTTHNKASNDKEFSGNKTDAVQSNSSIKNKPTDNSQNLGENKTEKVPKSSLRKTSSTRSALSLVFDISQNQTITRSNSVASSRPESRQAKYHVECNPVEDPDLKVENWARLRSARSSGARSSSSTRPGSEASLLGRRESVTNLIFAGQSQIDVDEGGLETIYWKKLQLQYTPRSSLLFNRMSSSLKECDVTPGDFNVMVDEDYSLSRLSKVNTPTSSTGRISRSPARSRTGFLYQVTDFDRISKDVPAFVRHYAQKNGKMVTESFILRLNYLRRRRQLGENSSTINIGNSNNSNSSNNSSHHGHAYSHNTGNSSNVGKRSSPTAV